MPVFSLRGGGGVVGKEGGVAILYWNQARRMRGAKSASEYDHGFELSNEPPEDVFN